MSRCDRSRFLTTDPTKASNTADSLEHTCTGRWNRRACSRKSSEFHRPFTRLRLTALIPWRRGWNEMPTLPCFHICSIDDCDAAAGLVQGYGKSFHKC